MQEKVLKRIGVASLVVASFAGGIIAESASPKPTKPAVTQEFGFGPTAEQQAETDAVRIMNIDDRTLHSHGSVAGMTVLNGTVSIRDRSGKASPVYKDPILLTAVKGLDPTSQGDDLNNAWLGLIVNYGGGQYGIIADRYQASVDTFTPDDPQNSVIFDADVSARSLIGSPNNGFVELIASDPVTHAQLKHHDGTDVTPGYTDRM